MVRGIAFSVAVLVCAQTAYAQSRTPVGPSGNAERAAEFDRDRNGVLDAAERAAARRSIQAENADRPRRRRGGTRHAAAQAKPGRTITTAEVEHYSDQDLYDLDTLRTIFLEFPTDDWEAELSDFYRTDITVPATMIVDGQTYPAVGVGFRGNSSFFTLGAGQKRSLSISVNATHSDQRLLGYRSLNLLNAHADPSFVREVLFAFIARHYTASYKVNLVRVVINGENWGIYVNSQQFNSDFTRDFFGERDGVRWKFPPGRDSSAGTLIYAGQRKEDYPGAQLKTPEDEDAWDNFIRFCRRLEETPVDRLDTDLSDILNVDGALWFLALDNLLIDGDGYLSRASDYVMYQDPGPRFHLLHYDSNETFRNAGGGGPGVTLPTDSDSGTSLDPFVFATDATRDLADRPLARLLDNPRLRARYAAHVRTITKDWIDWKQLGPVYDKLTAMIDADVKADTRKLYSYAQFASGGGGTRGAPTIEEFIANRGEYLSRHPELLRPVPAILSVAADIPDGGATSKDSVDILALVGGDVPAEEMILYFSAEEGGVFHELTMKGNEDSFTASIPPFPVGTTVRYYVEARGKEGASFSPKNTERGALSYRIRTVRAPSTSVVINEILTSNTMSAVDPQGDYDDYIELKNTSDQLIDISGFYLSDNPANPRKWMIPFGTTIAANGYLIIWADEAGESAEGLHANFKLAKSGESITLIDRDDRDNLVLDSVTYENLRANVAYGRLPDGQGPFTVMHASAGARNTP